MKKIMAFLLAVCMMGCVNSRAQIPTAIIVEPLKYALPLIHIVNHTDYRISITTPNINSVITINSNEKDTIYFPESYYPPKFCQLSLIAWNKDGFPMGSASREIKILKYNPTNTVPLWKITNQDLEY